MAFRLADVKRTVRSRSDGERYLHPKLLDPISVAAQVTLALAYFRSRLGRVRREVDPEMLVRFFGDPKVARGLVTCLSSSYRWRTQEFAEVLEPNEVAYLESKSIRTPVDLRLFLFDAVNARGHGFLAPEPERDENLKPLAYHLRLTGPRLDQLVALDAEEHAVLVRVGPVPEPDAIVALYNYHTVDALLRHSVTVELEGAARSGTAVLEAACAAYNVPLTWRGDTACLHNTPDAFGGYSCGGLRMTRALYSAAATTPALLTAGRAAVHLPGKRAFYLLDRETRRALTGRAGTVRLGSAMPNFRDEWSGRRVASGTAGWRLHTMPEPVVTRAGLTVAPFACARDEDRVLLWPLTSPTAIDDFLALRATGLEILAVVADEFVGALPPDAPHTLQSDGVAGILSTLNRHWGGGRVSSGLQALEGLLDEVGERGFVSEAYAVEALGCPSIEDLPLRLRALDTTRATYVPGIGLCSVTFAEGMRKGLRRKGGRPAA